MQVASLNDIEVEWKLDGKTDEQMPTAEGGNAFSEVNVHVFRDELRHRKLCRRQMGRATTILSM